MSRLYNENIKSEGVKNFFSDITNCNLENDLSIVYFKYTENSEQRYIEERNYSRNIFLYD